MIHETWISDKTYASMVPLRRSLFGKRYGKANPETPIILKTVSQLRHGFEVEAGGPRGLG
jgi:hypothetical protein